MSIINLVKKAFFLIGILLLFTIKITQEVQIVVPKKEIKPSYIGEIEIKKINIKEKLYPPNNPENTIEKHVEILPESKNPKENGSIFFLAAHSGSGNLAYFKNLNQLEIEDEIILTYENKKYEYLVHEIWKEKKTGYIHVNNQKEKQLILTTCDPVYKEYQIIISCIEKESTK